VPGSQERRQVELKVPALVVRGSESDMFAPETLPKLRAANPRITAVELQGSHDLAHDNPDGLITAVRQFLEQNDDALGVIGGS